MSALAAACAVGNAVAPGGGTAEVAGFAAGFGVDAACENATGAPHRLRTSVVMARRRVVFIDIDPAAVEVIRGFVIAGYLRRPPPPERAREAPTLADPRWLLLRAALLLGRLLEAPPKAFPFRLESPSLLGILRLPTRSLPPAPAVPRFAPALLVPGDGRARFALALPLRFAPAVPFRLAPVAGCVRPDELGFCRAVACRVATESPRAVPPKRFAVVRSAYGAPPRWAGL